MTSCDGTGHRATDLAKRWPSHPLHPMAVRRSVPVQVDRHAASGSFHRGRDLLALDRLLVAVEVDEEPARASTRSDFIGLSMLRTGVSLGPQAYPEAHQVRPHGESHVRSSSRDLNVGQALLLTTSRPTMMIGDPG